MGSQPPSVLDPNRNSNYVSVRRAVLLNIGINILNPCPDPEAKANLNGHAVHFSFNNMAGILILTGRPF